MRHSLIWPKKKKWQDLNHFQFAVSVYCRPWNYITEQEDIVKNESWYSAVLEKQTDQSPVAYWIFPIILLLIGNLTLSFSWDHRQRATHNKIIYLSFIKQASEINSKQLKSLCECASVGMQIIIKAITECQLNQWQNNQEGCLLWWKQY